MGKVHVDVFGAVAMQKRFHRIASEFPVEAESAVKAVMTIAMEESQRRTPVDTGDLRASHRLVTSVRGKSIYADIHVGGQTTGKLINYAVYVHENPDAHHPVGQYKFLESTLTEYAKTITREVARRFSLARLAR